jgi:hypothetical protein
VIKKPLIVGARGGMGRRYTAILRKMGIEPELVDVGDRTPRNYDGVIIASPTALHIAHLEQFLPLEVPILVEKPIATSIRAVERIQKKLDEARAPVDMVNQYRYLTGPMLPGTLTMFNYYNHGRDGLPWDCISIVGLAKERVSLAEDSPQWTCVINGARLSLADMDHAYITMIDRWVNGRLEGHGPNYIRHAHARVQTYIEANA